MNDPKAFPHDYFKDYLALLARHFPGDITLNQLRILQYIGLRSSRGKGHTNHKDICMALEMAASTVTRAVSAFIETGVLHEETDPEDGRRRLVSVRRSYPSRGQLNEEVVQLGQKYFGPDAWSPGRD